MRRLLPLALLFLTGLSPAPEPAPAPVMALDDDAESRWVDFALTPGNQISFALEIDGRPATAILDTGVSHSVVSPAFAARARLNVSPGGRASAIGGSVPIGWTAPSSVRLGGLTRQGGRLAVAALPGMALGDVGVIDALIGADILSCCALEIDYDAGRFRLLRSGRMPFAGQRAPLSLGAGGAYVSEVVIAGQRVRSMLVDTGDGSALTLTRDAWGRSGLAAMPATTTIAYGLGGPVTTGLAVVPGLSLGPVSASDVEVRIEDGAGFTARAGMQGRIGGALLQRFHVLLDPRAGQMLLQPGRNAARAAVRSTSGLLLGREAGRLRVLHVMRGGPAALSGWRDGEAICAVNGQPVAADGQIATALALLNGAPGQSLALSLCDGAERRLVLQRFY